MCRTKLVKIDIEAGELTFGQKIELTKIITSGVDEVQMTKEIIICLGGKIKTINRWNARRVVKYITKVNSGLLKWAEKEATLLKYEPTAEERKYGGSEMTKKFGEFLSVDALADKYKKDPDEILSWKYGKVFLIFWKDLERHKLDMRNYERTRNSK